MRFFRWIKSLFVKKEKPVEVEPTIKPVEQPVVKPVRNHVTKTISMAGVALIMKFEGFSAEPYKCVAGKNTIGYGTTVYSNGEPVRMSDAPITKEQASHELMYEAKKKCQVAINFMNKHKFYPEQNELDAICSFVFNTGSGPILNSDSTVHKGIVNNDRDMIARGMMMYNKARVRNVFGIRVLKEVKGLTRRRAAEVAMFRGDQ